MLDVRELSPLPGTSILMTSAPRSAISMYGTVPACAVEQATTFTPSSGPRGLAMGLLLARHCSSFRTCASRRDPESILIRVFTTPPFPARHDNKRSVSRIHPPLLV